MTNKDFLTAISTAEIDIDKVAKIESQYMAKLPYELKKFISVCGEVISLDEYRVLSFLEILYANDELQVDFTKEKVLPLIDCKDNTFIVYHLDTNNWSMYDIIELISFNYKNNFSEFFE